MQRATNTSHFVRFACLLRQVITAIKRFDKYLSVLDPSSPQQNLSSLMDPSYWKQQSVPDVGTDTPQQFVCPLHWKLFPKTSACCQVWCTVLYRKNKGRTISKIKFKVYKRFDDLSILMNVTEESSCKQVSLSLEIIAVLSYVLVRLCIQIERSG